MAEKGITLNTIIGELTRSPHGKLDAYVPVGSVAAREHGDFLAHLIAYNRDKGQIRDSKVALPVISLSVPVHEDFRQNALAHLALLVPRELLRAIRFALEIKTPGNMSSLRRLVERYLRSKEENWVHWQKTVVQHRSSMKSLYAMFHVKPSSRADAILLKGEHPAGTVFEAIANLGKMSAKEAAGTIMEWRIPYLIALGALGAKSKDPDIVLALIERMSPAELINNTKMLEKLGIRTVPALRAAYEQALVKAGESKKIATFKATVAVEAVEDETLKAKLQNVQAKQIKEIGISGNWAVLGDKSPSMELCIDAARHVASTLAAVVQGKVHLIFFDSSPLYVDVTGLTYDQILKATKHVTVGGGTSIGCGVQRLIENSIDVDGIAIISDAQENTAPLFVDRYKEYCKKTDKEPAVYLYRFQSNMRGLSDRDLATSMNSAGIELTEFDLRGGIDYYSLPNICKTMRSNRYSLIDEIRGYPLLTLDEVLKPTAALVGA